VPAKFVVRKGSTGKFRFNLVATNGQVIATSEAYETKARALAGVESVRKNAAGATLVDETAPAAAKPAAKAAAKPAARSAAKPARTAASKATSKATS
jgi:hypothetical protein